MINVNETLKNLPKDLLSVIGENTVDKMKKFNVVKDGAKKIRMKFLKELLKFMRISEGETDEFLIKFITFLDNGHKKEDIKFSLENKFGKQNNQKAVVNIMHCINNSESAEEAYMHLRNLRGLNMKHKEALKTYELATKDNKKRDFPSLPTYSKYMKTDIPFGKILERKRNCMLISNNSFFKLLENNLKLHSHYSPSQSYFLGKNQG